MIKIVGGKYRSRAIEVPSYLEVPSKSIVREGIANALFDKLNGSVCLDLFAGSGALGIEALSRGAKEVSFSDINPESIKAIKKNLSMLGESQEVFLGDYEAALKHYSSKQFDIVFLDPPYKNLESYKKAVDFLMKGNMVKDGGVIVIEYENDPGIAESGFAKVKTYSYGRTKVKILWR